MVDPALMKMYASLAGIMGAVLFLGGIGFVFFIAWKEIVNKVRSFLNKKGAYVYIISETRGFSEHYLTPKNNIFKIAGKSYVTNPYKALDLCKNSLDRDKGRIEEQITNLEAQKKIAEEQENSRAFFKIERAIDRLNDSVNKRERKFYKGSKASYLYREGDPVPIDPYSFYSGTDSVMLDNVIARANTRGLAKSGKALEFIKIAAMVAAGASIISILILFRMTSQLEAAGISFTV